MCDLCSNLIVAEIQLKQVAKKMALAESIPLLIQENKEPIIKEATDKMEYLQWRLLFYFDTIIVLTSHP